MPEMILPGTYIEVRAEGLIRPGPFSIGNVGIVGTARRGRLANPENSTTNPPTVYTPANIGEARDIFGQYDEFFGNPDRLTLVRALELAFGNGAQRVFAARVVTTGTAVASYELTIAGGGTINLDAVAPGTGYNNIPVDNIVELTIESGTNSGELNVTFSVGTLLEGWRDVPAEVGEFAQVIEGTHPTYDYLNKSITGLGSNLFRVNLGTPPATGNVETQTATLTDEGANGASPSATEYGVALRALLNQNVHIVVLAGQGGDGMTTELRNHVLEASTDLMKRERIGIIGSDSIDPTNPSAPDQLEGRLIFVGPGIKANDAVSNREVTLPGTYTAAAVAGRIASLDPHVSATNKTISANGLQTEFNGTQLEQLLLGRVLTLEKRNGTVKIVRAITTSTNTAWLQITTRRIVDFAKFGVRASANPFIGKLNNERVRQALKGSINSFLADMIDREMLIGYELEVSATRDQQIRGIAQVTMTLQPTFSIDFIRVVMFLQ